MCKKCVAAGTMGSALVVDDDNDLVALQIVDGEIVSGVIIGPITEQSVKLIEDYAKQVRQHFTLLSAEKPAVVN
ncbi:hypothetical protein CPT_Piffle_019 [Stenotrophomonas phage Piffle]|uniref:Uncharacterized protein n=1 Tax=Stenotrophomonas phage Piffle TaxID=2859656 RepID=A0AAE7WLX0_9CAUD|nr:hypothetical protein PP762_gp19 [Stenotrophomonas phage Piffle]QYW01879.1 hypothetical protein CPT_Piffle_019 [Stenotrophomonas phage Piffle]